MYQGLRTEIKRIIAWGLFWTLIGWLTGYMFWSMMTGGAIYALFLLQQTQRFYVWLSLNDNDTPPPIGSGIWGDIFDAIYLRRKREARAKAELVLQLSRLQEATSSLKDGVVLLDVKDHLVFWNAAAAELLGLQAADERQPLSNILRDPAFANYMTCSDFNEPVLVTAPGNANCCLELQINVFGEGDRLVVVRDVTRLQRLERMRSEFVANVSHELRTPLTVLKGYLEAMEDNVEQLPPMFSKAVGHMRQQSDRMQHLVNDLTLLSKLETLPPSTSRDPIALDVLARQLQLDAAQLSPQHRIRLVGQPLTLYGNASQLHSAFSNLLTNALRYTPITADIELRWGQDERGVYFSVLDHGPGIDPVHLPRLTERFYRADSGRGRSEGGTGLGLAIVKHALARHHGHLEVTSKLGHGSCFTCRLPAALASRPQS